MTQTHGDMLDWHPHVHAIATRAGWDGEGRFVLMPFVSTAAAEKLFRHKVITLLRDEELLSQERIELLMSWRHSGFSAHNAVTVPPGDTAGIERLARYLLRAPTPARALQAPRPGRAPGCTRLGPPFGLLGELESRIPAPARRLSTDVVR